MASQGRKMPSLAQVMALMGTITGRAPREKVDTQSPLSLVLSPALLRDPAIVSPPRVLSLHKERKTLLPSPSPWARSTQRRKRQSLVAGRCKDWERTNPSPDNRGQACTSLEATLPVAQQCPSQGLLLSPWGLEAKTLRVRAGIGGILISTCMKSSKVRLTMPVNLGVEVQLPNQFGKSEFILLS